MEKANGMGWEGPGMQVDRRTGGVVVMNGAFRVRSVGRLKEK